MKCTGTPYLQVGRTQVSPMIWGRLFGSDLVPSILVRVSPCSLRRGSCGMSRALFLTSCSRSSHGVDCRSVVWGPSLWSSFVRKNTNILTLTWSLVFFFLSWFRRNDVKSSLKPLKVVESRLETVASESYYSLLCHAPYHDHGLRLLGPERSSVTPLAQCVPTCLQTVASLPWTSETGGSRGEAVISRLEIG